MEFRGREGESIERLAKNHPIVEQFLAALKEHLDNGEIEWREQVVLPASRVAAIARAWIIRRVIRHVLHAQRVQLDIAHARQQICVRLHHRRSISPVPQGSATVVVIPEILGITPSNRLHGPGRAVLM